MSNFIKLSYRFTPVDLLVIYPELIYWLSFIAQFMNGVIFSSW